MNKIQLMKNTAPRFEITELIIVRNGSDWSRTWIGTLKRADNGSLTVFGKCEIGDGKTICAKSDSDNELFDTLDELCYLTLTSNYKENKDLLFTAAGLKVHYN